MGKSLKRAIKKKGRSRSVARWLDRSRSNSKGKSGQYVRATGWSSTVRWWEKKRESSSASRKGRGRKRSRSRSRSRKRRSSSSSSRSSKSSRGKRKEKDETRKKRPRQVTVSGHFAQFVLGSLSYYYNIATGQTTWDKPAEFDAPTKATPVVTARPVKAAV